MIDFETGEAPTTRLHENYWLETWEVRANRPLEADETVPGFDVICAGSRNRCSEFLLAHIMATPIEELFAADPEVMS